jgi:hypothetical protein
VWYHVEDVCTIERWDPDRPYDIVAKGYHMLLVHERVYVMLVRFIPLQGCLLIRIPVTLSDMSDSWFTAPLIEMHVSYDDGLHLMIIDDDYYY